MGRGQVWQSQGRVAGVRLRSWEGGIWGPLHEGCRRWAPRAGACWCLQQETWAGALALGLVLLQGAWEGSGLLVIQHGPAGLGPTSVASTPLPGPLWYPAGPLTSQGHISVGAKPEPGPFLLATYLKSTVDFPCPHSVCTGLSPKGGGATEWHRLMLMV